MTSELLRIFATVLVADYEMKKRYYIPILLSIVANCFLLMISCAIIRGLSTLCYCRVTYHSGIINGYIALLVGVLPNVGYVWVSGFHRVWLSYPSQVLRYMLKHNASRLARLTDSLRRYPNDKYSLSLRVQLKENIWSLQVKSISRFKQAHKWRFSYENWTY